MAESRLQKLVGGRFRTGLGGEGILRTEGRREEALAMLGAAYDSGIRYFDSAPAYAGSEEYLGTFFGRHPERKAETFQTSKSADRTEKGALRELDRTLSRLGRDQLGLWQIHDVRTRADIRHIEEPGGALEAFYSARDNGTVRGIGVTGHHDPSVLLHAVMNWDLDAVLLPVNPVEVVIGGFTDRVIPAARERGIGIIGMKTLGAGNYISPESGLSAVTLLRFALSLDVDIAIVGCSTPDEAGAVAHTGDHPVPLDTEEQERITAAFRPLAQRLAFYRGVI